MENNKQSVQSAQDRKKSSGLYLLIFAYFILIFIFAAIYYSIYNENPNTFFFNSDIVKSQSETLLKKYHSNELEEQQQLQNINTILPRMYDLEKELLENKRGRKKTLKETPPDYKHDGSFEILIDEYDFIFQNYGPRLKPMIIVQNSQDEIIAREEISSVASFIDLNTISKAVDEYISELELSKSKTENALSVSMSQIKGIENSSLEYWGYTDFLYFSVITQTTVGYGDILPNSSLVRNIVTIQILLGLFLSVFAFSILISRKN